MNDKLNQFIGNLKLNIICGIIPINETIINR